MTLNPYGYLTNQARIRRTEGNNAGPLVVLYGTVRSLPGSGVLLWDFVRRFTGVTIPGKPKGKKKCQNKVHFSGKFKFSSSLPLDVRRASLSSIKQETNNAADKETRTQAYEYSSTLRSVQCLPWQCPKHGGGGYRARYCSLTKFVNIKKNKKQGSSTPHQSHHPDLKERWLTSY